jgi:FKBP-type peptidyl-prolyl cis-trans isomerase
MKKMLAALALAAGLALAVPALRAADDPKPADTKADKPAASDSKPADTTPKGKPVPSDLPVVKKEEREGGLIVEDLKLGEGAEVKEGETVVAYYHGTVKADGTVFDSAFERGAPIAFSLGQVIQGWQKGVPGMKVGGVRRLIIPAAQAYGASPPPGSKIPANADLVFVIQLEDVLKVEDVTPGTGEASGPQAVWVTAFTLTDDSGKVLDKATRDDPYVWIPNEWKPLESMMNGMKVGGKRKARIPASINEGRPGMPTSEHRPTGVPLNLEVELIALRNLPPKPRP